jgi:hypothetical protein
MIWKDIENSSGFRLIPASHRIHSDSAFWKFTRRLGYLQFLGRGGTGSQDNVVPINLGRSELGFLS